MTGLLIWLGVAAFTVLLAVWVGSDCNDPYCVYRNTRDPVDPNELDLT